MKKEVEMKIQIIAGVSLIGSSLAAQGNFESALSADEFDQRSQELSEALHKSQQMAKTEIPPVGMIVSSVVDGKPAQTLGIRVNDVISQVGDVKIWAGGDWGDRRGAEDLVGYSSDGTRYVHRIEPGLIGIRHYPFHAPALAFRRKYQDEDAEWVDLAELGIFAWKRDSSLSKEAWFRALQKGYPEDEFSTYYKMLLSIGRGNSAESLRQFFVHYPEGEDVPLVFFDGIVSTSNASGEYQYLRRLAEQEPSSFYWSKDDLSTLAGFAKGATDPEHDLLVRARASKFEIEGSDLIPTPEFSNVRGLASPEVFRSRMSAVSKGRGMLHQSVAKPDAPLTNVHMTFIIDDFERSHDSRTMASYFHLGFVAGDYDGTESRSMSFPPSNMALLKAGVHISGVNNGDPVVPSFAFSSSGHDAKWGMDYLPYFKTKEVMFDLIRIGSEVACYVNEVCVVRMPIDPAIDDLSVYLTMTGCHLRGTQCLVRRLLP